MSGLRTEKHPNGVLSVIFDRPDRRNAFDEDMAAAMLAIFSGPAHDPSVRAVVLKGEGPHFCAGFDLKSRPKLPAEEGIALVAEMYQALAYIPVLTVALVDGIAYGGAMGFVAACDMVVATRSARFACPEGSHGMLPGVMAAFVTQAIGPRRAMTLIATAEPITAERAYTWGLISEVVEDSTALLKREQEIISNVLQTGPIMARQAKALMRLVADQTIEPAIVAESVVRATASKQGVEAREGFRAFREGRKAAWRVGPTDQT